MSGITQLLLIALLAAPIWLFGLLIGLLLPKGFSDSRAASMSAGTASSISSIGSDVAAYSAKGGPSSRPLSDDELAASSEGDEDWEEADEAVSGAPSGTAGAGAVDSSYSFNAASGKAVQAPAGTTAAAGSTVRRTVAWAQQLLTFAATGSEQQQQQQKCMHSRAAAGAPAAPLSPFAAAAAAASSISDSTAAAAAGKPSTSQHHHPTATANGLHPLTGSSSLAAATSPAALLAPDSRLLAGSFTSDAAHGAHVWYVGLPDLAKFTATVEPLQDRLLSGKLGQGWSLVM
jgi:hypothetical protein